MQSRSRLASSCLNFFGDESGRSFTEFTLLAAIVIVVLAFVLLAVRKISLPGA